ncbi:response regulator transcription factor [Paenibacillus sp. P96]|uniref:Response regulator transcription factor n=1 Tax=Paenibacillus zeirhizosphaerae TaxID=2987519 RepID=A0ABT9FTF6_9BACL|nr:response regulator transcription factor [Paenibacillus sp. P96]MDP4098029.1 response regulator transcription factor [Paenibacillus sp. P96]
MYNVMIVDDEPAIREGLTTIMDWGALGFKVADTAGSGREALAKLERVQPDLIIMDIRLPGMNGLDVIRKIQEETAGLPLHFLILSGYADFEYARQAIVVGADGYLLKPVDEEEMAEELQRIYRVLESQRAANRENGASVEQRRSDYLERLLLNTYKGGNAELEYIPPELQWPSYQVMLLDIHLPGADQMGRMAAARERLSEICSERGYGFVFTAGAHTGILLRRSLKRPTQASELLEEIRGALSSYVAAVYAAAGKEVAALGQLKASCDAASRLLERRFLFRGDRVLLDSDWPVQAWEEPKSCEPAVLEGVDQMPVRELADRLYYALEVANKEAVERLLQDMGRACLSRESSELTIKEEFARILTLALNKFMAGHELGSSSFEPSSLIAEVYAQRSLPELVGSVHLRLKQLMASLCASSKETVMKQIVDFIHAHYRENLKLELLAEAFNYNSAYLGKLFKSYTGESFNLYLDKVRIESAKELLVQGMKVHRVAKHLGYANADYFHAKFKKYVGCSPSAYRSFSLKKDQPR